MNQETIDLTVFLAANIINILLVIIFISRPLKWEKTEYVSGLIMIILGIPLLIFITLNFISGREWWSYILPLFMIAFLIIELFFDYIYKLNFRGTKLLIPYLIFFYLGLFGMIGYAFLTKKIFGFITLTTYFMQLFATWYSFAKVGHGNRKDN